MSIPKSAIKRSHKKKSDLIVDASKTPPSIWGPAAGNRRAPKGWSKTINDVVAAVSSHVIRRNMEATESVILVPYERIVSDVYAALPTALQCFAKDEATHDHNCLCKHEALMISIMCKQADVEQLSGADYNAKVEMGLKVLAKYLENRS